MLLAAVPHLFPRLTNAGPFIEDENQRDIRARILDREIDWSTLFNKNLSEEGLWYLILILTMPDPPS
jgi:serine/threonine/tyrosine protein kinase RAD53